MRRPKKSPDYAGDSRPKLNVKDIGILFGVSRRTMYRRLEKETFTLVGNLLDTFVHPDVRK
jgi:hypothetical protein